MYTPLALDEYAIDFACSNARLSASTDVTSGLGAPARTARPIRDRTRSTRLPAMTLPCLIRSSSACAAMMTTSAGSPRCRRFGIESGAFPIDAPYTVTT